MKITTTQLRGLLLIEPDVFRDERGFFFESFNQKNFEQLIGRNVQFVQDNHSHSVHNVLRGMHYQIRHTQGKLVRIVAGDVFDVSIDLRKSSPTFGKYFSVHLSAENKRMLWIPEGFAHGFLVLSKYAESIYKTTDYWAPEYERCIAWNDPDIDIDWPLSMPPILSPKDEAGKSLTQADWFA